MHLVKSKGKFSVYFCPNKQSYYVYKGGELIVRNKYKFSDVCSYVN